MLVLSAAMKVCDPAAIESGECITEASRIPPPSPGSASACCLGVEQQYGGVRQQVSGIS